MMEQVTGAATALVLWLAYLLIVECMMAAIVLLTEFIVLRVRTLWALVSPKMAEPAPVAEGQHQPYRVGGGLLKWE